MKKALSIILIIAILFAALFVLTGCGEKKEEVNETKVEEVKPVDETLITINGLEFHIDQDKEFKGLNYKVVGDFKEVNQDLFTTYVQYNYLTDDGNLLYFRIFYYEGKTKEDAVQDLGIEGDIIYTDGKTNDVDYKFYGPARDDGGTMHYYFIEHEGNTYAITFTSKYDIKDFEEKVMKSVKF